MPLKTQKAYNLYMVKAKSTGKTSQRDKMDARQVKGKMGEGYNSYLATTGLRFSGKPSGDRKIADQARAMAEPDWKTLSIDDLERAEELARHRISGGEASWQDVLARIRAAKRFAIKNN